MQSSKAIEEIGIHLEVHKNAQQASGSSNQARGLVWVRNLARIRCLVGNYIIQGRLDRQSV